MSDWTGPGLYRIESGVKNSSRVSLSGGKRDDGTPVVAWNDDPNHNDIWGISLAGIGWTGKNEYHIINYRSGTFLTYDEKAPERSKLTGKTLGPANSRVRWNLIPLRNRSGKYWIVPVQNNKVFLNLHGGKTDNNTELWLWGEKQDAASQWILKHSHDPEFFDFPDIGSGN